MPVEAEMHFYHRKLYALLHNCIGSQGQYIYQQLQCFRQEHLEELASWWQGFNKQPQEISSSSDRVNLQQNEENSSPQM